MARQAKGKKSPSRARKDAAIKSLVEKAAELGAVGAKAISPETIVTAEWVRWKCRFGCGGYGSSLVCPPHSPAPGETRKVLDGYKTAIFFEAAQKWTNPKKIAVALEREAFLGGYYKAFGLGAGPCQLCETCAFDEGCRHPGEARPAMEACGIDVYATARKHGFTIEVVRTRKDPQHYFGMVLIE